MRVHTQEAAKTQSPYCKVVRGNINMFIKFLTCSHICIWL